MIKLENLDPKVIPTNLISIFFKFTSIISKYSNLSWEEKKHVILSAFEKFRENIDRIFPGISELDKKKLSDTLLNIPTLYIFWSMLNPFVNITNNTQYQ
jgi:hypothetical protein